MQVPVQTGSLSGALPSSSFVTFIHLKKKNHYLLASSCVSKDTVNPIMLL